MTIRLLSEKIKQAATDAGFDLCGICNAEQFPEFIGEIKKRKKAFPEAALKYERLLPLADPAKIMPSAKSIIVCARHYGKYRRNENLEKYFSKYYLFETGLPYALHSDVNLKFENSLTAIGVNACKIDIPSRWAAVRSGIAKFAANNFIYTKFGSYVSIETWACDKTLHYDKQQTESACISGCQKCRTACPTGAITEKHSMNYAACITEIICGGHDIPDEETRRRLGTHLYGCDRCQDCCPLNKNAWTHKYDFPHLDEQMKNFSPQALLNFNEADYEILFSKFGFIKRDEKWKWQSNALRAIANSADKKSQGIIEKYLTHPDHRVRQMAVWAKCEIIRRTYQNDYCLQKPEKHEQ